MSPQTATPILTAEELYDIMMDVIEPDLLTKNIRQLDAKYAGESADEKQERLNHYAVSLEVCTEAIEEFGSELEADVRDLVAAVSAKMHADDTKKLQNIEDSMNQFPSDHVI